MTPGACKGATLVVFALWAFICVFATSWGRGDSLSAVQPESF